VHQTVERVQRSAVAQFAQKYMNDRGMDLAMVVAWGTLSTIFPVFLGITAIAGLVLRDPARAGQVNNLMLRLVPSEVATPLGAILDDTVRNAGGLGLVGIVLLLFNGSNLFSNMGSVFNRAYNVPDRPFVNDRLWSIAMLVIVIALAVISALAYGMGGFFGTASDDILGALPFPVPGRGFLAELLGYALSIVSASIMFLLLYRILPNKRQTVRQALPGALMAAILFFLLLQLFPLYTHLFGKGFETYAVFGMFLLLMFWTFLLGIVLVLGAELNAFLEMNQRPSAAPDGAKFVSRDGHRGPDVPRPPLRRPERRRRSRR